MKSEPADHSLVTEALQEAEHGGLVTLFREMTAGGQFGQSHRPVVFNEAGQDCFQGLGSAKTGLFGFFEEIVVERHEATRVSGWDRNLSSRS